MKITLLCALVALSALLACGTHYPHDPVVCTSDSDCAAGQKCLPEWTHPDGGPYCVSEQRICLKPCTADSDCSYCGTFGVCAVDICDKSGPRTCGAFCGTGK